VASPFGPQIRIVHSWSQWIFFVLLIAFTVTPLWFLWSAVLSSLRASGQTDLRFQAAIALIMALLTSFMILALGALSLLLALRES
jgi:hypothetical protein